MGVSMLHELVKSISIIFYEALCCKMFAGVFLKQRTNKAWYNVLSLLVLTICFVGIAMSSYMQGDYIMRAMSTIMTVFVFLMIFYSGKNLIKLFVSFIYYGLMISVDYFCFMVMEQVLSDHILENAVAQVLLVLLCKTVFFLVVLALNFLWKKQGNMFYIRNGEWCLILGFPFLTVVFIVTMLLTYEEEKSSVGYVVITMGLTIMNFFLFFLINHLSAREQKLSQIQLLQARNKQRMQTYQELSTHYQEQRKILHDYNNQIACVQGLLSEKKYDEATSYLNTFSHGLQNVVEHVDVNHPVLNVILNQKYKYAKDKGICILFLLNDLSCIWLEEQDIVILLSNLLDNAIEACEKVNSEKIIRLKLLLETQQIVLSIQNPLKENLIIVDENRIKTSKKDSENHGIGLQNVKQVIDKYHGISGIHCEDKWFYYTAVIPKG